MSTDINGAKKNDNKVEENWKFQTALSCILSSIPFMSYIIAFNDIVIGTFFFLLGLGELIVSLHYIQEKRPYLSGKMSKQIRQLSWFMIPVSAIPFLAYAYSVINIGIQLIQLIALLLISICWLISFKKVRAFIK
ncbi:hypothetical protein SAMN05421736_10728 [Evansella caseinilytica]|uniref:Uncharacterized protein n=1 Tax=Evansella caseinilytica TaxID=1503961 RepID=A0A1H3QSH0_9BACI|nr:hypothetical protein [Evansella caseinilytica]SDZ16280.1 hypothetical protein SAMN05421736_10728 [Evansella caseinilytica]